MNVPVRNGLIFGLTVVAWTYVIGFTGWYKDPVMLRLFWLVIPVQIGFTLWTLMHSRHQSAFMRQLLNGVAMAFFGSLVIFVGSYLFTTLVFPSYFTDLETLGRQVMAQQGLKPEEIEAAILANRPMATPFMNALSGVFGTLFTGLLVSGLAAVWLRKK